MPELHRDTDVIHPLDEQECWEELNRHEFGRLAYHLPGEVHIVPINYVADDGAIYFRTAEGSKLLGITMDSDVAFEVDDFQGALNGSASADATGNTGATSVVARGKAVELEGADKAKAEQLPLRPWVPTAKFSIVRIEVTEITGRRFDLAKPWEHMR